MITSVADYIKYFESIRRRTLKYIETIPPEHIDWSPAEGRFSCGDLIRHLAATEQVYVGVVLDNRWLYTGHDGTEENRSLEGAIAFMNTLHQASMERLQTLPDSELMEMRDGPVPNTRPVRVWRWLLMMVEHEVHHRSELASYITELGGEPPQIFGMTAEEMASLAQG